MRARLTLFQSRIAHVLLALPAVFAAGCAMDTQIATVVQADGSGSRTVHLQLRDLERTKEAETYPAKRFALPAAPDWTVEDTGATALKANAKWAPGQAVPSGYRREMPALERTAGAEVRLEVRDHFVCTSYRYLETYRDANTAEEFQETLLAEYERFQLWMYREAERELAATHELEAMKKYLEKDLQKLVADSTERLPKSGIMSTLGIVAFRLAMGGFPIKNANQLFETDPRDVMRLLARHCLNRTRLKPDPKLERDGAAIRLALEKLVGGDVDEQELAHQELLKLGPLALRAAQTAAKEAHGKDPESGAAKRLGKLAADLEAALEAKFEALAKRLAAELEDYYLKPPAAEKPAREKTLARMLGGHIEANFASIEYFFLVRLQLPGEWAFVGPNGHKLEDGTVRWNFSALDFFLKDFACEARSRVWKDEPLAKLGAALHGPGEALTVREREQLDEELAKHPEAVVKEVVAALQACAEQAGRAPLDALAVKDSPAGKAAQELAKALGTK